MGFRAAKRISLILMAMGFLLQASVANAAVSFTTKPPSTLSWTLAASGANTKSAGTFTVNATEAYTVTVVADVAKLSKYTAGAYASPAATIAASLSILTSVQSGDGVAVPTVSVATTAATIATGVGTLITPASHTYSLTLSQPTVITDPALVTGSTYHMVLTYTASPTL